LFFLFKIILKHLKINLLYYEKNVFLLAFTALLGCFVMFYSCSDSESIDFQSTPERSNARLADTTINAFKNDIRLVKVDSIARVLQPLNYHDDPQTYTAHWNVLRALSLELSNDYGAQNVITYYEQLDTAAEDPSKKCCKLVDGGVDWSCCNWWETGLAALRASFQCTKPSSFDQEERLQEAQAYYECVQDVICKTC
jgi:hypothetical protein